MKTENMKLFLKLLVMWMINEIQIQICKLFYIVYIKYRIFDQNIP